MTPQMHQQLQRFNGSLPLSVPPLHISSNAMLSQTALLTVFAEHQSEKKNDPLQIIHVKARKVSDGEIRFDPIATTSTITSEDPIGHG